MNKTHIDIHTHTRTDIHARYKLPGKWQGGGQGWGRNFTGAPCPHPVWTAPGSVNDWCWFMNDCNLLTITSDDYYC